MELVEVLKRRVEQKLFSGNPTVADCGEAYTKASDNTSGVGIACFASSREQERAFQKAFAKEALAARPYIYALENALLAALENQHLTDTEGMIIK